MNFVFIDIEELVSDNYEYIASGVNPFLFPLAV